MNYIKYTNEWFMNKALDEAWKAYKDDEIPVGAIIVKSGEIISCGHNQKELKNNPLHHAEMEAIKKASEKTGSWRLTGCDIYVTLEPCPMCAGALIQSRIERLFIGTPDPKSGAVGSVINILDGKKFNHKIEVIHGILQKECSQILKDFFQDLRRRKL